MHGIVGAEDGGQRASDVLGLVDLREPRHCREDVVSRVRAVIHELLSLLCHTRVERSVEPGRRKHNIALRDEGAELVVAERAGSRAFSASAGFNRIQGETKEQCDCEAEAALAVAANVRVWYIVQWRTVNIERVHLAAANEHAQTIARTCLCIFLAICKPELTRALVTITCHWSWKAQLNIYIIYPTRISTCLLTRHDHSLLPRRRVQQRLQSGLRVAVVRAPIEPLRVEEL